MKIWFWRVALIVSLVMAGAAAAAEEAAPKVEQPEGKVVPITKNSLQHLKAEKQKKVEAQKAVEDEKSREQEKKDKTDKLERKLGHKPKSWQLQNR